jgi:hypothetical protein
VVLLVMRFFYHPSHYDWAVFYGFSLFFFFSSWVEYQLGGINRKLTRIEDKLGIE